MKKKVIIGILILVGIVFFARTDYKWGENIKENQDADWIVVSEHNMNGFSLWKPWTWVKKPTTEVLFTKKEEFGTLSLDFYYARTKYFSRGEDPTESLEIIDTKNMVFTSVSSWDEVEQFDLNDYSNYKWVEYDQNGVMYDLVTFISAEREKFYNR